MSSFLITSKINQHDKIYVNFNFVIADNYLLCCQEEMEKMSKRYYFDCNTCVNKCDGISKGVYDFKNDTQLSEYYENLIIDKTNESGVVDAKKCEEPGYPDIELKSSNGSIFYIEVKFQQRTFMSVKRILPDADLFPSNTLALNQSDLLRYFDIREKTKKDIYIVWGLSNRPCIIKDKKILFFYQHIDVLKSIYEKYKDKRRFRRASGKGDIVDGIHKGVVVNWHYSLEEFEPFILKKFIEKIGEIQ